MLQFWRHFYWTPSAMISCRCCCSYEYLSLSLFVNFQSFLRVLCGFLHNFREQISSGSYQAYLSCTNSHFSALCLSSFLIIIFFAALFKRTTLLSHIFFANVLILPENRDNFFHHHHHVEILGMRTLLLIWKF